jgi:hypothetical protein
MTPRLRVRELRLFERNVRLRIPFGFGRNILTESPQVFVRAEVEIDGQSTVGQSAELLAPKWFDKDPGLSNEQNFDQLRSSLRNAARLYLAQDDAAPAFALHAAVMPVQYAQAAAESLNGLIASYGMALVDRAVLDALCRARGVSVFAAVRANLPGMTTSLTPEIEGAALDGFLAARALPPEIWARHTVGMVDPLTDADVAKPLNDGLPESLEAVIATYGNRYFKIKVGADIDASVDRLIRIAVLLDRSDTPYFATLDGNEQFADIGAVAALFERIEATPQLARLWSSTLFVEQPIGRDRALSEPVHKVAQRKPLVIDESDAGLDVFPRARELGYAGVSAKSCKGVYRALLNAARASAWNSAEAPCFITAEDLTTQPGICLQQSLAIAALVGATHAELNGHHYVGGFPGAPSEEQARFAQAHSDLYEMGEAGARLRIRDGRVAIASLDAAGFSTACQPAWDSMREI